MSGLNNLNKRLKYRGGASLNRLDDGKVWSLRLAMKDSYQTETIILNDLREFKCLINPDKLKPSEDNKILSIPFQDFCLNPEYSNNELDDKGMERNNLKVGDTFIWKETNTHWLVYLQNLEETAYFKSDIVKCEQEVNIGDKTYWAYIRGPVETSIPWNQKGGIEWNDLNHSLVMFITHDENTKNFFTRFQKIKLKGPHQEKEHTWQVVGSNPYHGDGIIQVFLDEYFDNTIEEEVEAEKEENQPLPPDKNSSYIDGPNEVNKYDTVSFVLKNIEANGKWFIEENGIERELNVKGNTLTLNINKSKGIFTIKYKTDLKTIEKQVQRIGL